ncbi:hypothetical protein QR680_013909 [Steinernema hermaphroditum]|uniref:Lipase domain-containing protein n=1 Tax=Steinernema hermaphroditum TaxID=289476 RepID=A0AA39I8P2_9BILA|nr:hypothetical protein QR680_013909 [Steinernema hermaphroditum]
MWSPLVIAPFLIFCVLGQKGPLTQDFQSWLKANGYEGDDFARNDLGDTGSFGGFDGSVQKAIKAPVIFVHGNSDGALDNGQLDQTGWSASIQYFISRGYTSGELYATTWGDRNPLNAASRTHNCETVQHVRRFIDAVISYTKAEKVNIISHSMGVTLARKAVKGGKIHAADGVCNLGAPLTKSIEVFVGLAGANYGMCNCEDAASFLSPTCNRQNGFWPGDACGINVADCGAAVLVPCIKPPYSSFLTDLNGDPSKEGKYVFSAWSLMDNMIMYGDQVWGRPTSLIPASTDRRVYPSYDHFQTKDLTFKDQYSMIAYKTV